jgi:hypothetical protein
MVMGVRTGAIPHPYILNRQLTDADFAVDLMRLYRRQAPAVYQDPEVFLRQTYPTAGSLLLGVGGSAGDRKPEFRTPAPVYAVDCDRPATEGLGALAGHH